MKIKFIEIIEKYGITEIKRIKPIQIEIIEGLPTNCEEISEPHNPYYPICEEREREEEMNSDDIWRYGREYSYPSLENIIGRKYKCLVEQILEINGKKYQPFN